MRNNLWTLSNSLMFLCLIFTVLSTIIDLRLFGMNAYFYDGWNYLYWILQMFTSQFLHGSPLHLMMNAFFVLYFWNVLERLIGEKKMIVFFILNTVFLWVCLTLFTNANTIWISWFAMALLSYYTLELYRRWNPEYTWGVTALVINIGVGFYPGISLIGHLWGAIFWLIFYSVFNRK